MTKTKSELPEHMKKTLRALMSAQMDTNTFDVFEGELFDWYIKETEAVLNKMLSTEKSYIQEIIEAGVPDINDSGMVAVEYYTKRIRYSHVIYLTSLLESCLERACSNLTVAIGKEKIPFELKDLKADQWSKRRKFLERYGSFSLPSDLWAKVKTLITVRNFLVHENGNTESLKEEQRKQLTKCPGLAFDSYVFKIEESFVQHGFLAVKSFVNAVDEQVEKVVQRVRHAESTV